MNSTLTEDLSGAASAANPHAASTRGGPEVSIIVPTYNESGSIGPLLRRIEAAVVGKAIACEILVMDDSPSAETVEAARAAPLSIPLRAIRRSGARGLSEAVMEGIREARGRFVLVMDADLQHPPESIADLVRALREGADFVIGSRHVPGAGAPRFSALRRLNSWGASLLCRPLLHARVTDPMSGFFGCLREAAVAADLRATGYKIGLELLVKTHPVRVVEAPITFGARHAGASKMTLREQGKYVQHLARLYGWRYGALTQFLRFCCVGACGMLVDLGMMALLVSIGLRFPAARTWSILTALPVNFLLNRRWTFRGCGSAGIGAVGAQFLRFVGACSIGLLVSWSVSNALYWAFPAWQSAYALLCAAGIGAGTMANFHFSRNYAFAPSTAHPPDGSGSA
ncbi:MAG: glycosyltransferase family 2 protein [Phycisphaerales bacterium]|nr:glycosyltransferase family 2 protein [Phycisphaerales bacterium]